MARLAVLSRRPFGVRLSRDRGWGWRHVLYYGAPIWAFLLAGVVVSLLLLLSHIGIGTAYSALYQGALGNRYNVGLSLTEAVPLVFTGLAVGFAYRCGLFNIGAEGQLQVAGLTAAVIGVKSGSALAAILGGLAAGAIWSGVPGYARARFGVNEVISTLMLNFVAITFVIIIVSGPFADPQATYPTSPAVPNSAQLPTILSGTPLHLGFVIALCVAVLVFWILYRTPLGFRIRAVGMNAEAAKHAGIKVSETITAAMIVSGALAGLGGAIEVLGVEHRVATDWSPGWGFTGIAVAFLARTNPVATFVVALLYGGLEAGAQNMQLVTGVPGAAISIIEGLPILFLIAILSKTRPAVRGGLRREQLAESGPVPKTGPGGGEVLPVEGVQP